MDKRNLPILKNSENCSRCGACIAICPKNAISQTTIEGGQWIPVIDETKCIKCRKCEKVCKWCAPKNNKIKDAYVAYNSDIEYREKSASGGVFSSIAQHFIRSGGIVCGAELVFVDGKALIQHVLIDNESELSRILKSKYVQSETFSVFLDVKKNLNNGKKVLFSGTSCQVNSLRAYLDVEHVDVKNLYTIDIICHGTPPSKLFCDYIKYISTKYKGQVQDFQFRLKENERTSYTETIHLVRNDKDLKITIPWRKSSYYSMFLGEESYNLGCYNCKFATIDKPSDITVGDYFELKRDNIDLYNSIDTSRGISAVIVHTDKGEKLLNDVGDGLKAYECDLNTIVESHGNLRRPSTYSYMRCLVFLLYDKYGYRSVAILYHLREIMICIPRKIKHKIRKID